MLFNLEAFVALHNTSHSCPPDSLMKHLFHMCSASATDNALCDVLPAVYEGNAIRCKKNHLIHSNLHCPHVTLERCCTCFTGTEHVSRALMTSECGQLWSTVAAICSSFQVSESASGHCRDTQQARTC